MYGIGSHGHAHTQLLKRSYELHTGSVLIAPQKHRTHMKRLDQHTEATLDVMNKQWKRYPDINLYCRSPSTCVLEVHHTFLGHPDGEHTDIESYKKHLSNIIEQVVEQGLEDEFLNALKHPPLLTYLLRSVKIPLYERHM